MIKNAIYIRTLSVKEKKILQDIASQNNLASGLETIRFIIEDYKTKMTTLNYQAKVLAKLKQENEDLKITHAEFIFLENQKNLVFEKLKKQLKK